MFNTQATQQDREKFAKCANEFKNKFDRKFPQGFGGRGSHPFREILAQKISAHKSVNIFENENDFTLQLFAAGLEKENFKASVKDKVLTISYNAPAVKDEAKYIHQEFFPTSFERAFQLNEKVLADQISASYENGILKVVLPKNPEKNQPAQDISVN